jgi:hypothetical protein
MGVRFSISRRSFWFTFYRQNTTDEEIMMVVKLKLARSTILRFHDGVKWPTHARSLLFALLVEVLAMIFLSCSCTIARGWHVGLADLGGAGRPANWPYFFEFYAMQLKEKFKI